jgi:hypothetical protein
VVGAQFWQTRCSAAPLRTAATTIAAPPRPNYYCYRLQRPLFQIAAVPIAAVRSHSRRRRRWLVFSFFSFIVMMNDPSTEFGSFEGSDEQHGALFLEYKEQFVRQRHLLLLLLRFKMVLPSKPEVVLKQKNMATTKEQHLGFQRGPPP